jgi:hypothetical protein
VLEGKAVTIDANAHEKRFLSKLRFNRDLQLYIDTLFGYGTDFTVGGDAYDRGHKISVKDPRVIKLHPYAEYYTAYKQETREDACPHGEVLPIQLNTMK